MKVIMLIVIIALCVVAYSLIGLLVLALFVMLAHEDFLKETHHIGLLFNFVLGWPLILVIIVILAPALLILKVLDREAE